MISRREFIKLFGISAIGVTSGLTASRLLNSNTDREYICGFIPNDDNIIASINNYVKQKTGSPSRIIIKRVNQTGIKSNIITGDDNSNIYSLTDLNKYLFSIRDKIIDRDAQYYFEADLSETNIIDKIFPKERKIVIKNSKGIFEIVDINKDYNLIKIPGEQGATEIKVTNNLIRVINSPCRHKLCMKLNFSNSAICVPNKVTVQKVFV